ncbi:MAG: DJ-1/PfpI family protein [Acidimicrobiia bacterium]|nr:DJ-1/PfpI family protein [Acidimicrobiia bacterium]
MQVACALYDEFTMLDIVGPFQVLSSVADMEIVWVAEQAGPVSDHTRTGSLGAAASFEEVLRPDIVVIPGGLGTTKHLDGPVVEWVRAVHPTTTWTTSVCTGSLLLAAAGLLDGLAATSHWAALDTLGEMGAVPTLQRVVIDHQAHIATAAGVSAGIDMALELVIELQGRPAAEAAQLAIEYDPQPVIDAGSPLKAPPETVELLRTLLGAAI